MGLKKTKGIICLFLFLYFSSLFSDFLLVSIASRFPIKALTQKNFFEPSQGYPFGPSFSLCFFFFYFFSLFFTCVFFHFFIFFLKKTVLLSFCFYFLGVGVGLSFSRLGSALPSWGWPFLLRVGVGPSFLLLFFSSFVNVSLIFDTSWTISTTPTKDEGNSAQPKRKGRGRPGPGQKGRRGRPPKERMGKARPRAKKGEEGKARRHKGKGRTGPTQE